MQDVSFKLISRAYVKDATGQMVPTGEPTEANVIGLQKSVYQNEFYKADQAGIRAEGVIEMNKADYGGQPKLILNGQPYSIYRTYEPMDRPDTIELYYGERVGNG